MGLKEEQELKNKYLLDVENFNNVQIVKLTIDNVAKVEAMITTDSKYIKSNDINAFFNRSKKYYFLDIITFNYYFMEGSYESR